MPEAWRYPLPEPVFIKPWLDKLAAEEDKPHAAESTFRISQAGDCSRGMALKIAGAPQERFDPASAAAGRRGTLLHEDIQASMEERFDVKFEVVCELADGLTSGHCDGYILWDGDHILWELKTVSDFKFQKAIGYKKRAGKTPPRWAQEGPGGPTRDHIAQVGQYAVALNADRVFVTYLAVQAISVGAARECGCDDYLRFTAEWEIPEEVWGWEAQQEVQRQLAILTSVRDGFIPVGTALDGDKLVRVSPYLSKRPWNCDYCAVAKTCESLPDGPVPIAMLKGDSLVH